ncbi:MAG TPA: FkbM family methyltransferase [Marmoricola sp.]|nr:FkbM family methyltransferase [Marmoricola sp.]
MQQKIRYLSTQVRWKVRSLLPDSHPVRRSVQGVDLWMPRAHRLHDFARVEPIYGQNLVAFAQAIDPDTRLQFVDVGANIGDSTVQVLAARDGAALCVEADGYWLPFLTRNTEDRDVTIAHHLLVPDGNDSTGARRPVRNNQGTTTFSAGDDANTGSPIQISALPVAFKDFDKVRLIKSDTDGYDVVLVPELARTYAEQRPGLFFEFDIALSHAANNLDPEAVFTDLASLGYSSFAAWDNFGRPVGTFEPATVKAAMARYHADVAAGTTPFWDIAAVHADDADALAQLTKGWTAIR